MKVNNTKMVRSIFALVFAIVTGSMKRVAVLAGHINMMPASEPVVLWSKKNSVSTITLNRVSKLNSLSMEMIQLLIEAYYEAIDDTGVKLVVMRGEGKAFSAGGDVAAVREQALTGGPLPHDFFHEKYMLNHTIATAFERHGLPQIALWHLRQDRVGS